MGEVNSVFEESIKSLLVIHSFMIDASQSMLIFCVNVTEENFLIIIVLTILELVEDFPEGSAIPSFNSIGDRQLFLILNQALFKLLKQNQDAFRNFTPRLPLNGRTKLENILKSMYTSQDEHTREVKIEVSRPTNQQPKIQLKSFF